MKQVQGILGFGEVGKAIKQLLSPKYPVVARDLNLDEFANQSIAVLHICIPYTDNFVATVAKVIEETQPQLVIIHSTVKPGTTQELYELTQVDLIHTPFNGVHPQKPQGQFVHGQGYDLADYFQFFPKIIGPTTDKSAKAAVRLFKSVGLKTVVFNSALEAELSKIMCTTYYGWNILFEKWVHSVCSATGADFDQVYTQYNHIYNAGYEPVLPQVRRPVLTHHAGPIGGHCVVPNAEIIKDWLHDDFTKFMLQQNDKLKATTTK